MKTTPYPLAVPEDLLGEVRHTEQLAPAIALKPFTPVEAKRAFGPDPEGDALAARLAHRRRPEPRDDQGRPGRSGQD